jgi:hypothetical protein
MSTCPWFRPQNICLKSDSNKLKDWTNCLRGKSIAIVGNAEPCSALNNEINSSDHIIRFNKPPISNPGEGKNTRTDTLVISNSSKQTASLMRDPNYLNGIYFSKANNIIFPYSQAIIKKYMPSPRLTSRLLGRKKDYTHLCIDKCIRNRKQYSILTDHDYLETCKAIGIGKRKLYETFPSSGIMIIHKLVTSLAQGTPISLYGFTFQGWKKHAWCNEKKCIRDFVGLGILTLN